ncbi:hypothetical protein [Streptomyces sp. NPDC052225]|uniref:hypothetical protein n=1 Tax=Streptomyces sp. NPDC052225 TaxID=3154949 RepID=UPI003445FD2E
MAHTSEGNGPRRRLRARWGLLFLALGAVLFALVLPAEADNRAYETAPPCPAARPCTTTVPATVTGKETESGRKSSRYYLRLTDRGTDTAHRVRLAGRTPVYAAVGVGDRVRVTYWKGEPRAVTSGSATQRMWRFPFTDGRLPGAFAVLALGTGLGVLWAAWWQRRRAAPEGYPWQIAAGLVAGIGTGCVGLAVTLMGDDVWQASRFTALAAVPVVLASVLLCWGIARRTARAARRVVPVPPTGRRVVRAAVHGDVPYSRPGYGHLVIGDGAPAATPDPSGSVALAPLPPTLTVRRVRALSAGDPDGWWSDTKHRGVVIECADGDRTVLVAAGRKDASLILGALDYRPSD